MSTQFRALAIILLVALAIAGCSTPSPTTQPQATSAPLATTGSGSSAATRDDTSSSSDASQPSPTSEPPTSSEDDTFEADVITSGLASLDRYRTTFTMSFDGTDDGQPSQWTFQMDQAFTKNPPASRIAYSGSGDDDMSSVSGFEMVRVNDMSYIKFGAEEGNCIVSSADDDTSTLDDMFALEDVVGGLSNARRAGPDETINGVRARHYVIDQSGLLGGMAGFTQAEGEVWVATEGDYIVKYLLSAEGKDTLFGKANSEGKLTWEYEVSDVNQRFEITPPADCESAASDIPVMPDATEQTTMGAMITYKSASPFREVVDFYQDEMPNNGWEPSGDEPMLTEELAMLTYEKDGKKASITITTDGGQVSVLISIEEP
jgi:hypothetical protein